MLFSCILIYALAEICPGSWSEKNPEGQVGLKTEGGDTISDQKINK